jgi:predicted CXXCH cytochrome family protein
VRPKVLSLAAAAAALALGGVALAVRAERERNRIAAELAAPRDLHGTGYVGSAACRRCHAEQYASWRRTFHRTMTTEATSTNILGDFSGATLSHAGVGARMDKDEAGRYRMTFTRPGAPPRVATVVRAVGSRRYQQYLAAEGDTLWRLPVAYDLRDRRWFPMTGAFLFSDPEPWKGSGPPAMSSGGLSPPTLDAIDSSRPVYGGGVFDRHVTRWNDNCVFCHNVAPNPGREPATGAFRTTVAELGIACEACHGPGAEHARRNADPARREVLQTTGQADPTIVNPSRLAPARAADDCGRCHGQRIADDVGPFLAHGDPFVAGDDLALYSAPLWRDTPLAGDREAFAARFWRDGTPRLTAYEYQGMLQSACAIKGALTCTSCHGMHEGDPRGQLRAAFAGPGGAADRMCTGCHKGLAAPAALAAHARHDPAGEGARCVGCHMPRIVYGVLDVHRSHRIEIPDAARARAAGRPDACGGCHLAGPGAPLESVFAGDPVTRAVSADAIGRAPLAAGGDTRARLGALLAVMADDRYPAVRHIAWRGLRRLPGPGGSPLAADYDPSGTSAARTAVVARVRVELGIRAAARDRGRARDRDLEIGE